MHAPPQASGADRRAHTRRHIAPESGVRAQLMAAAIEAVVCDISQLGVLVQVAAADVAALPGLGAELQVELSSPGGPSVRLSGKVVWLGGSHTHGTRHFKAGLAFAELEPATQAALSAFIDGLPEG